MKFIVITAKHHDGFAMYKSKHPYNIVDAGLYGKDPITALAASCKKLGVDLGFYYSQSQDWHEKGAVGNDWDFKKKQSPEAFQKYFKEKVVPQVDELTKNYGPLSMIWFDTTVRKEKKYAFKSLTLVLIK
jgi:alpha-L-fucosidase